MKKTMVFDSVNRYMVWAEGFEDRAPVLIDDGHRLMMDIFTSCRSWKTALKRFHKAFEGLVDNNILSYWTGAMRDCANAQMFSDKFVRVSGINSEYHWAIERVTDNTWYIYLNISGTYAGR